MGRSNQSSNTDLQSKSSVITHDSRARRKWHSQKKKKNSLPFLESRSQPPCEAHPSFVLCPKQVHIFVSDNGRFTASTNKRPHENSQWRNRIHSSLRCTHLQNAPNGHRHPPKYTHAQKHPLFFDAQFLGPKHASFWSECGSS